MNQILPWLLSESGSAWTHLDRSSLRLHPACTALIKPACRCWKDSKFWCNVTRPQSIAPSCTTDDFIAMKKTTQKTAIIPEDRASSNATAVIAVASPAASQTGRKNYDWININLASPIWIGKQTRKFLHTVEVSFTHLLSAGTHGERIPNKQQVLCSFTHFPQNIDISSKLGTGDTFAEFQDNEMIIV